jgi:hypothetical protein
MYKHLLISFWVVFILSTVNIFAQDESPDAQSLEAMMKLANPNENHELLEQLEGDWNVEWIHYYSPDAEPFTGTGQSKNEMVLGGRFLQLSGTTIFNGEEKKLLQFIGYDNRLGYNFLIGMDEFGTYAIFCEGEYNREMNQWNFVGVDLDPTGTEDFPYRIELSVNGKNEFTMDTYIGNEDEEMKAMSVKYMRK